MRFSICPLSLGSVLVFSDSAIQSIVLEAPWFKSSQRLCAYVSCSALREVDTSRILSETLQHPPKGVFLNLFSHLLIHADDISEFSRIHLATLMQ